MRIFKRADDRRPPAVRLAFAGAGVLIAVIVLELAVLDQAGMSLEALRLTGIVLAITLVAIPLGLLVDAWVVWPILQNILYREDQ